MPIPTTRDELVESIQTSLQKLHAELDSAGRTAGSLICVDDWTVKDLLAVRCWWSNSVCDWIEAGLRDEMPITPAEGFGWNETPRLNAKIVECASWKSYRVIREELQTAYRRVIALVETLNDRQLLETEVFTWAGKHPVSRWISINTTRQYETACKYVRKAKRDAQKD